MNLKIVKKAGMTVILDKMENISTCSIGVFVKTGSSDENENESGISHLLEHMIFKGTKKRNAVEISEEIDFFGAGINAHTSKEETVFYVNTLSKYSKEVSDILFDIVTNSIIDEKELEREKGVVIEEINMYKDTPDDLVFEMNYQNSISGSYGKPIIGTEDSVNSFSASQIREYYKDRYTKDNMVISIAGNFDETVILEKVEEYFANINDKKVVHLEEKKDYDHISGEIVKKDKINQVNICITFDGISYYDDNILEHDIATNIIGGSLSSRLFTEIREKRGLAYSVYAYNQSYSKGGITSVYIGTNKESYKKAIEVTLKVFKDVQENGLTEKELQKAKNKYISKLLFSTENMRSRMNYSGIMYLRKNKLFNINELLEDIDRVTIDRLNEYLKKQYDVYYTAILGNV